MKMQSRQLIEREIDKIVKTRELRHNDVTNLQRQSAELVAEIRGMTETINALRSDLHEDAKKTEDRNPTERADG